MPAEGPALPNAIWAFRRALGRARGGAMEGPRRGHLVHAASVCARACEWAGELWKADVEGQEKFNALYAEQKAEYSEKLAAYLAGDDKGMTMQIAAEPIEPQADVIAA